MMADVSFPEWGIFDAIYLINLPERTDRRRELQAELRAVGLRAGDDRLVWVRAVRPAQAGEFASIGARGCFLSHLECLKSACEHGHQRVLILEDDACFPRSQNADLRELLLHLKKVPWSLWYGGHRLFDTLVPNDRFGVTEIQAGVRVDTAHCIAFQGEAIRAVRAFLELILTRPAGHPEAGPMHVDGAYNTWRHLNPTATTLISLPPSCLQRSSRSDIATTRWVDQVMLIRQAVAVGRRLRNLFGQ
jgi:hypothetical protein